MGREEDGHRTTTGPARARRFVIGAVGPTVDGGRHPLKRILGESCPVAVDILREGHDVLAGRIVFRGPGESTWRHAPLAFDYDRDRWHGAFTPDHLGRWTYAIEAWTDRFATWRHTLAVRAEAACDVTLDLLEGAALAAEASAHASGDARATLARVAENLGCRDLAAAERVALALHADLRDLVPAHLPPDRPRARRPRVRRRRRSGACPFRRLVRDVPALAEPGAGPPRDAARRGGRLPAIAALGFDVVYLPPIHPIGHTHRKGPNNAPTAGPDDPGSPWAIGGAAGGHTAVEPALGTLADFDAFVATATSHGLEVALDYAPHCSPDHPWVREHPDWFAHRPDGIDSLRRKPALHLRRHRAARLLVRGPHALWTALRDVLLFWIARGVRAFRVDNPHTKPFAFWEWVIARNQRRPSRRRLPRRGVHAPEGDEVRSRRSASPSAYTYFIWRTGAAELRDYLTELATTRARRHTPAGLLRRRRPTCCTRISRRAAAPAFRIRLLLAATLSPLYGIYSGYELCEATPLHAGSEEYLDSEKFQLRQRDWSAPATSTTICGS